MTDDLLTPNNGQPAPSDLAAEYFEFLTEEGYRPSYDEDGDIAFKVEGAMMCLLINEQDTEYLHIALPHVAEIESNEEYLQMLQICAPLQAQYKGLKIVVTQTMVWICHQGFRVEGDIGKEVLPRIIGMLRAALTEFHSELTNYEEKKDENADSESESGGGVKA